MKPKIGLRVKATRPLLLLDDGYRAQIVPLGMTGTVVGSTATPGGRAEDLLSYGFKVDWDFIVYGPSVHADEKQEAGVYEGDWTDLTTPLHAVEFLHPETLVE